MRTKLTKKKPSCFKILKTRSKQKGGTSRGKYCSPSRNSNNAFSCYSLNDLNVFAKSLNISVSPSLQKDKQKLWNTLDENLKSECNTEYCWASKFAPTSYAFENIKQIAFRPPMPLSWKQNTNQWLNSNDIRNVMTQYESAEPGFRFIGPVPLDFQTKVSEDICITSELCKVNVLNWWKEGTRKLGIVFNLDPHDMPGSHWVASYCDFESGIISYYDSFGTAPPQEIHNLLNTLAKQCELLLDKPVEIQINNIRHQFKNTECGIYSIYFLSEMSTKNISFKEFIADNYNDKQIQRFRSYFYNTFDLYTATTTGGGNGQCTNKRKRKRYNTRKQRGNGIHKRR
mgnify:CR=1 FL=1